MVDLPNESEKATRKIKSSNIYDEVPGFDSIANAQIDMICHYDEEVSFDSIPDNHKLLYIWLWSLKYKSAH